MTAVTSTNCQILSEEQLRCARNGFRDTTAKAMAILKLGDRIRITNRQGRRVYVEFSHWDGRWIVSKSGVQDIPANAIDRINGQPIDFTRISLRRTVT